MKFPARFLAAALGIALTGLLPAASVPRVSLQLIAEGLVSPVSMAALPDQQLLVADQIGLLRVIDATGKLDAEAVVDWRSKLSALNQGSFDERGLLCVALHPGFAQNRRVFLTYTAPRRASAPTNFDCTLRLSEVTLPASQPLRIDLASEKILLDIDKPYFNHNGGRLAFGPDGLLYLSVGDGGGPKGCDIGEGHAPEGNGQNLKTLLAKILRIDVNQSDAKLGTPYGIPLDNPYANGREGRPEIYAYGVRNPWGLSFDRTGDRALYIADVGQMRWEEVDIIKKGGNYGWPLREGFMGMNREHPELAAPANPNQGLRGEPLLDPIAAYKNISGFSKDPEALGGCVTGGYVYRGKAMPEFVGHYVFGDWSGAQGTPQGRILIAWRPTGDAPAGGWKIEPVRVANNHKLFGCVCGYGQDNDGELYLLTNGSTDLRPGRGRVYKLGPAPAL